MQKLLAILIVIVCTVLLQAHSIPFWLEQSDSYIGYLWSFTIEGVALWLWLNKKMVLATIASAIVILVPLMQLSNPLLKEIRTLNANIEIKELNSLSILEDKKLQDKYLSTNWAGTINKNITHLRSEIDNQKEHLINTSELKSVHENIFIIVLQSVALIVVLLTQILAIRMLAFRDFPVIVMPNSDDSVIIETPETRAEQLLNEIDEYISDNDYTQSQIAILLEVPSSSISRLRNRVSGQGEPIGDKKLRELEIKFKDIEND